MVTFQIHFNYPTVVVVVVDDGVNRVCVETLNGFLPRVKFESLGSALCKEERFRFTSSQ